MDQRIPPLMKRVQRVLNEASLLDEQIHVLLDSIGLCLERRSQLLPQGRSCYEEMKEIIASNCVACPTAAVLEEKIRALDALPAIQ